MDNIQTITVPQQKALPSWSLPFPLILSPADDLQGRSLQDWLHWLPANSTTLKQDLLRHGAILFRGFPLESPNDFDNFVKQFGFENFPYVGGAATRRVIVGNVFTSNEAPSDSCIPYHHEMAQVPDNPDVLFFYCDVAPGSGGETPLVLSHVARDLIQDREPGFVARLEEEGVRYIRVAPDGDDPSSAIGRGWQSTFGGATDRATAEQRAAAQGTTIEWLEDGSALTVTKVLPATRLYERTGRVTWFNSIIAAYVGWNDARNEGKRAVVFGGKENGAGSALNNKDKGKQDNSEEMFVLEDITANGVSAEAVASEVVAAADFVTKDIRTDYATTEVTAAGCIAKEAVAAGSITKQITEENFTLKTNKVKTSPGAYTRIEPGKQVGEPMPEGAMSTVLSVMEELEVAIPWQRGDVIMIDNKQVLHARRAFTPPRTILACLCKDSLTQ